MKTNLIQIEVFKEENILELAKDILTDIEEGNSRPLPAYIQAKALEKLSKEIIKGCKDQAMDEVMTYGNDKIFNGAKFSLSNTGDTLDYMEDEEFRKLKYELDARKDLLKSAHDMHVKGKILVDDNTGEAIQNVSIKKYSEQIIKVSFK